MGIGSSRVPLPPPGQASGQLGAGPSNRHAGGGAGGSRPRIHSHMSVQPSEGGPSGSGLHNYQLQQYLLQQQQSQQGGRHRSRSLDFLSGRPVGGGGGGTGESDEDPDSDEEEDDGPAMVSGGGAPRPQRQRGAAAAAAAASRHHHQLIRQHLHGVPASFYRADIRCPVCSKTVPHDQIELHLVVCLTKPRISYNEDVLTEDKGAECAICLDELCQGDTIARLPCLCIYHKGCIDDWFKRSRSCPEHPGDG